MYPHVFPPHWIKETCIIFYTLHYFTGLSKNWTPGGGGGGGWGDLLTWNGLGKGHMGEGGEFQVGEDTPKDTMLVKQAGSYI